MAKEEGNRYLTERESAILKALVSEFILSGKPVGSRSFVQKYAFNISPATMRNTLFDLEKLGFLMQPHTSAGRIPTDRGYRYYVNSLLDSYEFVMDQKMELKEEFFRREIQLDKVFASITKMMSAVSSYAGVVLSPKPDFTIIKHIQLVALDYNDILVILVTRTGMVLNKKISLSESITQDDLYKYSKFLTEELCGFSLFEIRTSRFEKLRVQHSGNFEYQIALDIAQLALNINEECNLYVEGLENILHIPEMVESKRLESFLRLIEEKTILSRIMQSSIEKDGVSTLIGEEIRESEVLGCSIITSSYKIGNKHVGVVGVIGPTRMDYKKVVPLVDYTGKVITEMLNKMSK